MPLSLKFLQNFFFSLSLPTVVVLGKEIEEEGGGEVYFSKKRIKKFSRLTFFWSRTPPWFRSVCVCAESVFSCNSLSFSGAELPRGSGQCVCVCKTCFFPATLSIFKLTAVYAASAWGIKLGRWVESNPDLFYLDLFFRWNVGFIICKLDFLYL